MSLKELEPQTNRLVLDNYLARNFSRNTDQKKVCLIPTHLIPTGNVIPYPDRTLRPAEYSRIDTLPYPGIM